MNTFRAIIFCLLTISFISAVHGQDEAINNLRLPADYETSTWGELVDIKQSGTGTQDVILIPGWGFDHSIFDQFMKRHEKDFHMYAITIPGFGSTQAPPMPIENEVYSNLHWTNGVVNGIIQLIDREKMSRPVIISCFTYANMIAMRLALDHPDKIGRAIIISGMSKFTFNYPSFEPRTLKDRMSYIDNVLSKRWFKTVTKETWDNGNFHPGTFTRDSVRAFHHWNMMSTVSIPVMVRYLCESYCIDQSIEYDRLKVPTLIVIPGYSSTYLSNPKYSYIIPFFHSSWIGTLPANDNIKMITIQDAHAFIMDDQPEKLDALIDQFVKDPTKPIPPLR